MILDPAYILTSYTIGLKFRDRFIPEKVEEIQYAENGRVW